jgi:glutamate N-acetyltransferase/amino-acid N-acetyltransferase
LLLALFDPGTTVAGVLTQSKTASAPVEWCRQRLGHGMARALVVNSGNANAFTGMRGREAVKRTAEAAAAAVGCPEADVYLASTGVIGEPLDARKITHLLGELAGRAKPDGFVDAAVAIMTTDTYPKLATRKAKIDDAEVNINGIAKGAGMIAPDMATMLAFIFTDAAIEPLALRACLQPGLEQSFNAITIDGDTSTSDTLLVFATGAAAERGCPRVWLAEDPRLAGFRLALAQVMRDLALQVVKDGEGLTRFVTVKVTGAESDAAARRIARSIANSPLVKTAIAGADPNWGRVVMAIGKAGEAADRDRIAIWLGDILVAKDGEVAPEYREAQGATYMKNAEIAIRADVGIGQGTATTYTCDLTQAYVAINADYRS